MPIFPLYIPNPVFWKIAQTEDNQALSPDQAQIVLGAGLFAIQSLVLLPFAQVSTFFFDKKLFAAESSIGLYPAWIYSLSQLVLELWVVTLCSLAMTAIVVPMMSLWNPSLPDLATFVTMFTVFCVGGAVGNIIVLVTTCFAAQHRGFMAVFSILTHSIATFLLHILSWG